MGLLEKLEPTIKKLEETKLKLREEFKLIFKDETKELFERYDWLKEIAWSQYTPYFNDGDSCEFGVNEAYVNGCSLSYDGKKLYAETYNSVLFEEEDAEEFIESMNEAQLKEFKEVENIAQTLNNFLCSNEDIALMMFGDHVKVSIQRDGVFTEEYDHD
jgi:hypothetical protein